VSLFAHQVRADQLVFWRGRESAIFVFLFPVLLYLLLSTVYSGEYRGRPNTDYLTSSLIAYGVANTTFGGLAIILVMRRELGILKRIRATPLPAPMYLAAALCSILAVFVLQATTIMVLGRLFYHWHLPEQWPSLFAGFLLGALCFAGMGFGAASLIRSGEGASAVVNVVILPMTFLSGGFGPTTDYPSVLQAIADVLPLTYLVDIVQGVVYDGTPIWEQPTAVAVLFAWGLAGTLIAVRYFSWEPRER
jgi:ABC-2 type transport system permease protein